MTLTNEVTIHHPIKHKSPESQRSRALNSKSLKNYFFFLAVFFLATFFLAAFFFAAILFPPVEPLRIECATVNMVTRLNCMARGELHFFSFFYCHSFFEGHE